MADVVAVMRRREARKFRNLSRRSRDERRTEHEQAVAVRMVGRFYGGHVVHLILLDYRYWLARRCGWNPLAAQWRHTGAKHADGRDVLYEPYASPLWLWWAGLHYTQRKQFTDMTPHGLRRASNALPSPTYLLIQKDLAAV